MPAPRHYLALDLELTQPSRKIIQVGVAVGSLATENIETFSWLIDPGEPLTEFIVELTGITDEEIAKHAVSVCQVAEELSALIQRHPDMAINPVTWGGGDSTELLALFQEHSIPFPHFGRRWTDVKTLWAFKREAQGLSTRAGLKSAMGSYKLPFRGRAHRADVDAENTLRLYLALLRQEATTATAIRLLKQT